MRSGWSDDEVRVLMHAYVELLQAELRGETMSKVEQNRRVQEATGRSKASVEFKFCNLSAVMVILGYDFVAGYKPRINFQRSMLGLAEDFLADHDLPRRPESERPSYEELGAQLERMAPERISFEAIPSPSRWVAPEAPQTNLGEPDSPWAQLRKLWAVTTGGTQVAAAPDQPLDLLANGPSAPGISESIGWFKSRVLEPDGPTSMLFLVGGPGAGKSHTAATLVQGLEPLNEQDALARRRYDYSTGHSVLTVVNDATIPSEEATASVSTDVNEAVSDGRHLFACVNRGILVQDQLANSGHVDQSVGAQVVRWLINQGADADPGAIVRSMTTDDGDVDVLVVYLDVCSLFESRPTVAVEETGDTPDITISGASLTTLGKRAELEPGTVPGLKLLADTMKALEGEIQHLTADGVLHANLSNLLQSGLQRSLVTMLRCSELQSSQYFTYRELWGAISRAVVGSLPREGGPEDAEQWDRGDAPADPQDAWKFFKDRAAYRWPQALFDSSGSAVRIGRDPVGRLTIPADPARDARPGRYDPNDPRSGWASPVLDAFASQEEGLSPLDSLISMLPANDEFNLIVHEFDRRVDRAYMKMVYHSKYVRSDKNRAELGAWYGGYLTRLYAAAHGITAFMPAVALWLETWHLGSLPYELDTRLRSLLRPKSNPDNDSSPSLLPLFDAKARPITGRSSSPRLALQMTNVDLNVVRQGNALKVEIIEQARQVATVDLDFPLIREALASSSRGHEGLTDLTPAVSPRLERIRSAHLTPQNMRASARLIVTHEDSNYQIGIRP